MNKKYQKYIDYIVNDLEAPYFINMRDSYGLSPDEYEMVLSKIFKQPVSIMGRGIFNEEGNNIYYENSDGRWEKWEYNEQDNIIYYEGSSGYWYKTEYDDQGNQTYYEDINGRIEDNR